MNREIKFRAWVYDDNKMVYPLIFSTGYNQSEFTPYVQYANGDTAYKRYPVMQFTGLYDKNGKEIYEGDIVAFGDITCPITFENGSFQMITNKQQGNSGAIQERLKHFEIIGNIFENPELVEQ